MLNERGHSGWIKGIIFKCSLCPLRHTTPEKFFIEACDDGAEAVLAIDRVSNEMTLTGRKFDPMLLVIFKNEHNCGGHGNTSDNWLFFSEQKRLKSQHFITCKLQTSL